MNIEPERDSRFNFVTSNDQILSECIRRLYCNTLNDLITWLLTKASNHNLSALGTHFECEGVKCTFRTSLSDHGNVDQRSRSAPPSVIYTTLENARPMGNGSQLKAMCSVATILMNGPILVNNLNVIFIDNLNHRSSYGHPTSNAVLQITNQLLRFHVSTS